MAELMTRVELEFERTSEGVERRGSPWPSVWDDEDIPGEAYSRITGVEKWLVIEARCEAWVDALVGLHRVEAAVVGEHQWQHPQHHGSFVSAVCLFPVADAQALTLVRYDVKSIPGVIVSVEDEPTPAIRFPDCGCDACFIGWQHEVTAVDEWMSDFVSRSGWL